MAKEKKQVERITDMEVDFAKWYTDVCTKAELIDYTSTKGMFILRPYGYAIWENIQKELDADFKRTGHTNVSMPMLIPESLLQKEKDHVSGFAPECAWVTHGGNEKLEERLCIRPTSETLFCDHWSHIVHSWRDLPLLYNQWCSVLRWEKTSRPFLRHREFLWQEGHTLHATPEEAIAETEQQLETYANLCENILAMPVIRGQKTDKEKFAGAERTYTIECMMHDRKALQAGTSHYFGDGFPTAFDITFTDQNNQQTHPFETSWGLSTRIIGGIIMTHGDNNGLVLPPRIAPIQVIILPIAAHKPGVTEAAEQLVERLKNQGLRAKVRFLRQQPRLEVRRVRDEGRSPAHRDRPQGPGEESVCGRSPGQWREDRAVSCRAGDQGARAAGCRSTTACTNRRPRTIWTTTPMRPTPWRRPRSCRRSMAASSRPCGAAISQCELDMKEKAGMTSRCIPFQQEHLSDVCPICGKKAEKMVYWGVAY